jgi:hypothetical protein
VQMMSVRGAGVWRMALGSGLAVIYTIVVLTNLLGCLWLFTGRKAALDQGWLAQTYSAICLLLVSDVLPACALGQGARLTLVTFGAVRIAAIEACMRAGPRADVARFAPWETNAARACRLPGKSCSC